MARKVLEDSIVDAGDRPSDKSINQLANFLEKNEKDHFNMRPTYDYRVSSGSILFDLALGGGFGPGIHRFIGGFEGGKTSATLIVIKNFLETVPKAKAIYVKAEGKFNDDLIQRSGIKFVTSAENWVHGTCFVFDCKIAETVYQVIRNLIDDNPSDNRYLFVLDSSDALVRKEDEAKAFEEAAKVAGGALLASVFLKNTALNITRLGHMLIVISQVRSNIKTSKYEKDALHTSSATGGNAWLHNATWMIEFASKQYKSDFILNDATAGMSINNKPLGHYAKIEFQKTPNETTGVKLKYPIKHGVKSGNSVWHAMEMPEALKIHLELVEQKGSWFYVSPVLVNEVKAAGLDMPDKFQGEKQLVNFFDEHPDVLSLVRDKIIPAKIELLR